MVSDQTTEERIFEAARDVFYEQGYDGARMQEIARKAGINQSMLHYYYRNKDKLFDAVFKVAAAQALGRVFAILDADLPLFEKIDRFAHTYIEIIAANPHIPAFVLQELRRNPDRLSSGVGATARNHLAVLRRQISEAAAAGQIRPISPEHLVTNMFALSVFPFIARPILQTALELDASGYDALLSERGAEVSSFIIKALKP